MKRRLMGYILAATAILCAPLPTLGAGPSPHAHAGKVLVAHQEGNGSCHPVSISVNALPAHLAHGDCMYGEEVCDGCDNDCNGEADEGDVCCEPVSLWKMDEGGGNS